jgi:hypothetical protein
VTLSYLATLYVGGGIVSLIFMLIMPRAYLPLYFAFVSLLDLNVLL